MPNRSTVQLRQSRHQRLQGSAPLERFGDKRRCDAPGCSTVLSRYNPSSSCSAHAGWQDQRSRRMG